MGSVGDCFDNAMAESTIGPYKTELIWHEGPWRTVEAVELATLPYIDWFNTMNRPGNPGGKPGRFRLVSFANIHDRKGHQPPSPGHHQRTTLTSLLDTPLAEYRPDHENSSIANPCLDPA
jgi:hypothetical protein